MKHMRRIIWVAVALSMASCATVPVKPNIECRTDSNACEIDGALTAVFKRNAQYSLLQALFESTTTFDAASISLEISSTAAIPSTGQVDIELIDSTNGSVQASGTFAWVRSGSDLLFANPNAVNSWALSNGGTADAMTYVLHPFIVTPVPGTNSMTVSAQVDGVTATTASTTWVPNSGGGPCRTCQQQ